MNSMGFFFLRLTSEEFISSSEILSRNTLEQASQTRFRSGKNRAQMPRLLPLVQSWTGGNPDWISCCGNDLIHKQGYKILYGDASESHEIIEEKTLFT